MSEDEVFAFVVSAAAAAVLWGRWMMSVVRPPPLVCPVRIRKLLIVGPLLSLALLVGILLAWSASDVRTSPVYMTMYTVMGAAWVAVMLRLMPALGISPIADVIDRRNMGAAWATTGAMIGLTLSFAGGNIGDGPGWWVVVFSAGLGTIGMFGAWAALDVVTGLSRLVTVERDTAAGVRLGALLAGMGLIMGRSVAGDWHSYWGTVVDFVTVAWPAFGLVMVEGILGIVLRPTRDRPRPSIAAFGAIPAVLYLGIAASYLVMLGWWI